jgi:hypothetical protein
MSAAMLASAGISQAGNCVPCGGCSDPCASGATTIAAGAAPRGEAICEPVKTYKVVMEPKYVTESRPICVTETRNETRYRTKMVYKTVPVTETKYRTKTVNVPHTETKTITYSVLVPVKSEKTVELTESVPVWTEVPEEYTVRVPTLVEVPETYTVKVPQLQEESFTFSVNVPQAVVENKVHTVINAVPVTKTRTIQVCVPQTTMKAVTKDYGHWEDQVIEVPAAPAQSVSYGAGAPASSGRLGLFGRHCGHRRCCVSRCAPKCSACGTSCGGACGAGAGGCGSVAMGAGAGAPGAADACTTTVTKRVWVPNCVTENVPVTTTTMKDQVVSYTVYEQQATEIPYECTKIVYVPEMRTTSRKVCVYVDEERTRMRKVVQYSEEKRTRMRKELTYVNVTKTETVPHLTYTTEQRTKEVSYTYNVPECSTEAYEVCRYDRVCEEQIEEYTVCVPYMVTKEQKVQVCKMVPKLVETIINPCCDGGSSASGAAAGCGCATPAPCPCGA